MEVVICCGRPGKCPVFNDMKEAGYKTITDDYGGSVKFSPEQWEALKKMILAEVFQVINLAKGNRKRANETKPVEQVQPVCKVVPTNPLIEYQKKYPVIGMNQETANLMKESIDLSNRFQTVVKQLVTEKESIQRDKLFINELKSGKVKTPIMIPRNNGILFPVYDLKSYIKELESKIKARNEMLIVVEGQVGQWYDQYTDAVVRLKFRVDKMLENHPDKDIIKGIEGHRISRDFDKKEQASFIQGFTKDVDKLTDAEKKMIMEAAKQNTKQEQKCECKLCKTN